MHELSIALSIIDGVLEERDRRGGVQVEAVHLNLGAFSGVDPDALEFAYTIARQGTELESSQLIINDVPVMIHCPVCQGERRPLSLHELRCSQCGTPAGEVVRGRELEIRALEIAA